MDVPLKGMVRAFGEVIERTRKAMGDFKFYQYGSLRHNNCQDFVQAILNANGLNSPEITKFVYQPLDYLISKMPNYVVKFAQGVTDLASKIKQVLGFGRKKGGSKYSKSKVAYVMGEFKAGKLHSSSGDLVTDPKQAMAIALNQAKRK
jgi:hypothetical protein